MAQRNIDEMFTTPVYSGGRTEVTTTPLSQEERNAILRCYEMGVEHARMTAPQVAAILESQRDDFLVWAEVAKAAMDDQPITFPSKPGTIGVCWFNPQTRQYSASDDTQYNGWTIDTNEITATTAGTLDYFFGDGNASHHYKSYPTKPNRSMSVIAKDGLIEIGSTPSFMLTQIKTEATTQYGVVSEPPTFLLPAETGKGVYIHKTIGMVPLYNDLGIKWSFLPIRSCTPVIIPLGLTFYEHGFLSAPAVRAAPAT